MAALALFLALLLAISAAHKLMASTALAPIAARLAAAPAPLGFALLFGAAALEIAAALALLAPVVRPLGAALAGLIWLGYGLALWRHRGDVIDCGCDLARREKPVDAATIARPLLLVLLAAIVALFPPAPWTPDAPFAALAFLALWFAAAELFALPAPQRSRS